MNEFCKELVEYIELPTGLTSQVFQNCMNDGWRFQDLIFQGNADSCKFDLVPVAFGDTMR